MSFKCDECGETSLTLFRVKIEYEQSENWKDVPMFGVNWKTQTTPTLMYEAKCSGCGGKWGPVSSLLALRNLMIKYGGVLEDEKI